MNEKKQKWTVFSILGLLLLILFAAICIAPFIYMAIMSFTKSTTLMLHMKDINFTDFTNFQYVLGKSGFIRALINSIIVVFCSCLLTALLHLWQLMDLQKEISRTRSDFPYLSADSDDSGSGNHDSCIYHDEQSRIDQYIFCTDCNYSECVWCVPDPSVYGQCSR